MNNFEFKVIDGSAETCEKKLNELNETHIVEVLQMTQVVEHCRITILIKLQKNRI